MLTLRTNDGVKVGDIVVVNGAVISNYRAKVESIKHNFETNLIELVLNWGEFGKSKVYAHDRGKVWDKLVNVN